MKSVWHNAERKRKTVEIIEIIEIIEMAIDNQRVTHVRREKVYSVVTFGVKPVRCPKSKLRLRPTSAR